MVHTFFGRRLLRQMQLPVALLSLLLQRAPVLRTVFASERVWATPLGTLLRGGFAAAAMGGYHSLAGASASVLTTNPASPVQGTVGDPLTVVFVVSGQPETTKSYEVRGAPPPGVSVNNIVGDLLNAGTGTISGTPTTAGNYQLSIRAWSERNKSGMGGDTIFPLTIIIKASTNVAPTFTTQPVAQTAVAGSTAVFTAAATGTGTLTYQWTKDGVALSGAASSTLTLTSVTAASAGSYRVLVTNAFGTTSSQAASLTVTVPIVPITITRSPVSQAVATGGSVAFDVAVTGSAPTYQWSRNGQAIPNAVFPLLLLKNVGASDAGSYAVTVTNGAGSKTTSAAALTLVSPDSVGRLVNLSVFTYAGTGEQTLIAGFFVGGTGNASVAIRGIGPALSDFGVPNVLPNPKLEIYAQDVVINSNDDWVGNDGRDAGGFPLTPGGKDSVVNAVLPQGGYSAQVKGVGGTKGEALVEIYERTSLAGGSIISNLSARAQLDAGRSLSEGFVIGGASSRTVLIRAAGPALKEFGLQGVMEDPRLELTSQGVKINENDDWGGYANLAEAMAGSGAFAFASTSKDSVMLVTLPPGSYAATVTGVNNTGGVVIVEIYLLP